MIKKNKKYTIEDIKQKIEELHPGCKVLSEEYINNKTNLNIICEKGHPIKMCWRDISQNRWCIKCSGKQKHTIEDVICFIEDNHPKVKLLSNNYVNNTTKLDFICENNHEFSMSFKDVKHHWCPKCYLIKKSSNKKYTLDQIKEKIEELHPGAKLLSKEYINSKTKLNIICEKGHEFKTSFNSLNYSWCKECKKETLRKLYQFDYNYVKNYIENKHIGCKLLSKEYINNCTKLKLLCENNHIFYQSFSGIKNGDVWCAECYGNKKYTLDQIKEKIEKLHPGSKVLSKKYKNSTTKLNIICEKGHNIKICWKDIRQFYWCSDCKNKGETICREIFNKLFNKDFITVRPIWLKNPKTNCPLELDGYCEELNLAFEYNGIQHYIFTEHYHKTEKEFEYQLYKDKIKHDCCKKNNITLLSIKQFDDFKYSTIIKTIFEEILKYPKLLKFIKPSSLQEFSQYL